MKCDEQMCVVSFGKSMTLTKIEMFLSLDKLYRLTSCCNHTALYHWCSSMSACLQEQDYNEQDANQALSS